jgi:predicted transcriptional regulator
MMNLWTTADITDEVLDAIMGRGCLGATCMELRNHFGYAWTAVQQSLQTLKADGMICKRQQRRGGHIVYLGIPGPHIAARSSPHSEFNHVKESRRHLR